jgi:hypothetical protein
MAKEKPGILQYWKHLKSKAKSPNPQIKRMENSWVPLERQNQIAVVA